MPADEEEIKSAIDEGVEFLELLSPENIAANSKGIKLACSRMELGAPDESGRRRPVKVEGESFEQEFDLIVSAIGQEFDFDFIDQNDLTVEAETFKTNLKNVYIGGDALHGPANIITAIGDGKKVCDEIVKLAGLTMNSINQKSKKKMTLEDYQEKSAKRVLGEKVSEIDLDHRNNFDIVIRSLDRASAVREAVRCLYCDDVCNVCVSVCPNRANISYETNGATFNLQKIINSRGNAEVVDDQVFIVEQKFQVANIADFCNECGNCWTFCPTNGAPYKDKPKVCLTEESFQLEEKAYYYLKNSNTLKYKENSKSSSLLEEKKYYTYETEELVLKLNKKDLRVENVETKVDSFGETNLTLAAEMVVLLSSLKDLYLFNS